MVLSIDGALCKLRTNNLVAFHYNWCQFEVTGNKHLLAEYLKEGCFMKTSER